MTGGDLDCSGNIIMRTGTTGEAWVRQLAALSEMMIMKGVERL